MSRDIFVQDMPPHITEVADIPSDWMPDPLPYSHDDIVAAILDELGLRAIDPASESGIFRAPTTRSGETSTR